MRQYHRDKMASFLEILAECMNIRGGLIASILIRLRESIAFATSFRNTHEGGPSSFTSSICIILEYKFANEDRNHQT